MNAGSAFAATALVAFSTPVLSDKNPATASVTGRWVACVDHEVLGPIQYVLLLGAQGDELIGIHALFRIGAPAGGTGRDGIRNSSEFRFQYVVNDDSSLSFSQSFSGAINGSTDYTAEVDGDRLTLTGQGDTRLHTVPGSSMAQTGLGRRQQTTTVTTYTRSTDDCPL